MYVTTNDGSDMRINKEVKTLSKSSAVFFLGVGKHDNCYISNYCSKVILVQGKRNSVWVILKQVIAFLKIIATKKINSIHIINEQLYVFFYPFLLFKYTVLDLFDSIFLRKNKAGEKMAWLKKMLYFPANRIIVTDENRYHLMPAILRSRCVILPNYPARFLSSSQKESSEDLRILYNGWMGKKRGTEVIEGLLKTGLPLKVFMAGWFSDDYTKELVDRYPEQVKFLGVIPQQQALEVAQMKADYILCVYAPVNQNNINASPNKVYDAIQTATPLIINAEIKISDWVKENKIGFIMPAYDADDYANLYRELNAMKNSFSFPESTRTFYTWENVEENLLKAHQLT